MRPENERSQPSPTSASASCSQGLRKQGGGAPAQGHAVLLERADVHPTVEVDLGHEAAAGAQAQEPRTALGPVLVDQEIDAEQLREIADPALELVPCKRPGRRPWA